MRVKDVRPSKNATQFKMSPLVFWQRYQIAVDDDGIWRLPNKGAPIFIAWSDVATVRADDTMQRLVLANRAHDLSLKIDYQLNDFERLRSYVLQHTTRESRISSSENSIFYRTWINKTIILSLVGIQLLIGTFTLLHGEWKVSLLFFALSAAGSLSVTQDPISLEIKSDKVIIKFPGWKRSVSFADILSVNLSDQSSGGNVWAALVIALRRGKAIKLYRFREGSLALLEALQIALKNRLAGEGEPQPATPASLA